MANAISASCCARVPSLRPLDTLLFNTDTNTLGIIVFGCAIYHATLLFLEEKSGVNQSLPLGGGLIGARLETLKQEMSFVAPWLENW